MYTIVWDELQYTSFPEWTKVRVSDKGNEVYIIKGRQWVPEIIWNNCAEQMPPDGKSFIIEINGTLFWAGAIGNRLKEMIDHYKDSSRWTEFTKEKWEALNK